jgi:dipeptidase E
VERSITPPVTDSTIVAMGGGGFQLPPTNGLLDAFLLALARERAGRTRPRICYVPTAWADSDATIAVFHASYDTAPRSRC